MALGRCPWLYRIALVLVLFPVWAGAQSPRSYQSVLIETPKPYDRIVEAIRARGGQVIAEFKYVDGIAARIPEEALPGIRDTMGPTTISKDAEIAGPAAIGSIRTSVLAADGIAALATPASMPVPASSVPSIPIAQSVSINNAGTRVDLLHSLGFAGTGKVVAVVDTGLRPGFSLLSSAIVGGVDFVDDGPAGPAGDSEQDWKKNTNDGHGTFVAGLIAGNGLYTVSGVLQSAIQLYAPAALINGKLSLLGTAPQSKVYVVRIFGDSLAPVPKSTLMLAIQHLIEQRELYDRTGGRQGVHIDVANLSVGSRTLAAGRDLLDRSIDALLRVGIVPVISEGNAGPASLTGSSPGSAMSAVTVGGSSRAANERILNEVFFGTDLLDEYYPGIGGDLRPFSGTEVAWFSSRGPNADGRLDPDIVASSVGNIGQGYCPDQMLDACFRRISIASGTSFASPIVAGIAAVLSEAFPLATATQIRNAIILTGRTSQIESYFGALDRGQGLADAFGAYQLLLANQVPDTLPPLNVPDELVRKNIEQNTGLQISTGFVTKIVKGLRPGERNEVLYDVLPGTEKIIVKVRNVKMNGPQNPFYGGDALFVYVHSAKTSQIGDGDYLVDSAPFFGGEDEEKFILFTPDTGIMRITLNADTLNAGTVDVEVSVDAVVGTLPSAVFEDTIQDGKALKFTVEVAQGTTSAEFLLTWDHDWAHYPTNDLDMYVCSPDIPNTVPFCMAFGNKKGATLAGPERAKISNPMSGQWNVVVNGFSVASWTDRFRLAVTLH